MIAFAVAGSLVIGVALGLLGGGGSVLALPILIYALGVEAKSAIASSLFIVGVTSAVAAVQHARAGNVVWRVALLFASASMVGAFAGGRLSSAIPAPLLLGLFAIIMVGTAVAMWRGRSESPATHAVPHMVPLILVAGLVVGGLAGLVGAGGGFLVVPALALLGRLPMSASVGSSLVVIALSSLAGFGGHLIDVSIDWETTLLVTGVALVGSFVGAAVSSRVRPEALRRAFAVFVLATAIVLFGMQLSAP